MELILRNENLIKVKPLLNASFKCSYGVSGTANDFSVELPFEKDAEIKVYRYVNYGNSEFGGKILEPVIDTKKGTVSLYGVTLRGAMQNTIAARNADLTLSGTDVKILNSLFSMTTLSYIIDESYNATQKTVVIPIGSTLLQAVEFALREFGEKFSLYISDDKVHLKIEPTQTLDSRIDASATSMVLDDNRMLPNALHAIGIINSSAVSASIYVDDNGNLSETRYFLGDMAVEQWKSYTTNFKNESEFIANIIKDLLNARNKGTKTDIDVDLVNGNVGDKVKVSVMELGASVLQNITERHINFMNGNADFTYSTGG